MFIHILKEPKLPPEKIIFSICMYAYDVFFVRSFYLKPAEENRMEFYIRNILHRNIIITLNVRKCFENLNSFSVTTESVVDIYSDIT